MRFKAKFSRPYIKQFAQVLQTLQKVDNGALLQLTPSEMRFAVKVQFDQPRVYCSLSPELIFCEYRVESKANNVIVLELLLDALLTALKSTSKAVNTEVIIKLTKVDGVPYLTLETPMGATISVKQDVCVAVVAPTDTEALNEPRLRAAEVRLAFTELPQLKSIVDRFKSFERFMVLDASMSGTMVAAVYTDCVDVRSTFRGLQPQAVDEEESKRPPARAIVKLDSAKFARLCASAAVLQDKVILCLAQSKFVVLHFVLGNVGTVTYYMAVTTSTIEGGEDSVLAKHRDTVRGL